MSASPEEISPDEPSERTLPEVRAEAAALLAKADRALAAARLALTVDDTETAVSRLYYAAFYAARAALLPLGESAKTHAGVLTRFRARFEHTGRLPAGVARTLAYAFSARVRTDYEAFTVFDVGAATDLQADVAAFVATVRALDETA